MTKTALERSQISHRSYKAISVENSDHGGKSKTMVFMIRALRSGNVSPIVGDVWEMAQQMQDACAQKAPAAFRAAGLGKRDTQNEIKSLMKLIEVYANLPIEDDVAPAVLSPDAAAILRDAQVLSLDRPQLVVVDSRRFDAWLQVVMQELQNRTLGCLGMLPGQA